MEPKEANDSLIRGLKIKEGHDIAVRCINSRGEIEVEQILRYVGDGKYAAQCIDDLPAPEPKCNHPFTFCRP